jgi:uracil DNA glycosylase
MITKRILNDKRSGIVFILFGATAKKLGTHTNTLTLHSHYTHTTPTPHPHATPTRHTHTPHPHSTHHTTTLGTLIEENLAGASINKEKHHFIEAPHPSPLSKNFFGCKVFSRTYPLQYSLFPSLSSPFLQFSLKLCRNEILKKQGVDPINWKLP